MDAKVLKRKGRVSTLLPVMVQNAGKKEVSGEIQISANVIDNFSKLSAADKAQAPIAELSGTLLEFGKLPNKKNIVPLIGGKVEQVISQRRDLISGSQHIAEIIASHKSTELNSRYTGR